MAVATSPALEALDLFRSCGGVLRTKEALRRGIHPRTLYELRDKGALERLSRGVYRLAEEPPMEDPDLVTIAARVPKAVICLISALHFHGLTTEIPHEVHIALPAGTKRPEIDYPPIRPYWFSGAAYTTGIESKKMDGITVRIYRPSKAVADAFKFRNKLGVDVAVEALRTGLAKNVFQPAELLEDARVCRVERVLRPYLEALL